MTTKLFDDDKLYPGKAVREKLDIKTKLYTTLCDSGALKFIQFSPRARRFRGSDLNDFLERNVR